MIIGICGLIGSGKGTVADTLVSTYDFKKLSFADKLKDAVSEMFGWPRQMLEGKTPQSRDWRERPDAFWSSEVGYDVTPRHVLQVFGTECMRQGFFDGIWVSLVKQKIQDNPDTNWVLPDTRFPNEVNMIKSIGGSVWCIQRGHNPQWFDDYKQHGKKPTDVHPSEWAWAHSEFDHVIDNDTNKEDLEEKINYLIQDHLDATLVS